MDRYEAHTLERELCQFTGSETFYRHSLYRRFIYTEGVKYLADKAQAYWLLDYIFTNQQQQAIKAQPFQVWKIAVSEDQTAILSVEDGNDNLLTSFRFTYTDFPLKGFSLWLVDTTLLLPSEY